MGYALRKLTMPRVPANAFELYTQMGQKGSYEKVAKLCGVTKRAITKKAVKEKWSLKLKRRLAQSVQLEVLEELECKAVDAIKSLPINNIAQATYLLDFVWKHKKRLAWTPKPPETLWRPGPNGQADCSGHSRVDDQ